MNGAEFNRRRLFLDLGSIAAEYPNQNCSRTSSDSRPHQGCKKPPQNRRTIAASDELIHRVEKNSPYVAGAIFERDGRQQHAAECFPLHVQIFFSKCMLDATRLRSLCGTFVNRDKCSHGFNLPEMHADHRRVGIKILKTSICIKRRGFSRVSIPFSTLDF